MRVTSNGPVGGSGAPTQHPETMSQQHPPLPEGVLSRDGHRTLPVYDSVVDPDYHRPLGRGVSDGFKWWIEERQTDDGIRFDVGYFEPLHSVTDVAWALDTSWTTQVAGLNAHTAAKIAKTGMAAIVKGPEKNASIPLSHSAYLTHALLDVTDAEGFSVPKTIAHKGFSRGGMIGFGVDAYAEEFGRNVFYGERDDPCVAHHILQLTLNEVIDYAEYIPEEFVTIARQVGGILLDPRRLRHYTQTVDISLQGFRQVVRTGKPLFGGEAGIMADHVPKDAQLHVTFQAGMPANHRADYRQRLAGRQGVVIKEYRGTHTEHVSTKHADRFVTRQQGLVIQLREAVPVTELDFGLIHLPAPQVQAA